VRGSARIYDVRMAQFVLKIEKLSHIIAARGSQDLRSPSPIMTPGLKQYRPQYEALGNNYRVCRIYSPEPSCCALVSYYA